MTTIAPALSGLELTAGALRLALRPDLGGAIAGLWFDTLPVLRSTEPAELAGARTAACYPLVPYSNRIGYRRFRWLHQDHSTAPNFDDSPHSVHGVGWVRPWDVVAHDGHSATLSLAHAPDAHWPFALRCEQRFALTPESLRIELACTNESAHPAPVGLGWHPYFPKRSRSRVHAEISGRWDSDASGLPTRRVEQPGLDGDVAHMDWDHCFDGWRGAARIRDEKLSLRLSASTPCLVVYTPQTKPYFCVEPVSHVSNAIHMSDPAAHGLVALAPQATLKAWMQLDVAPA